MITNKKKERLTSQKKAVLDYLKSTKAHPSAQEVYLKVKKKMPQISQGTVYRILKSLKEKGQAQEIYCRICHYDADVSSHAHFFCQKCQRIYDVFKSFDVSRCKRTKVGKITNYQIYLYGICKKCQKKK